MPNRIGQDSGPTLEGDRLFFASLSSSFCLWAARSCWQRAGIGVRVWKGCVVGMGLSIGLARTGGGEGWMREVRGGWWWLNVVPSQGQTAWPRAEHWCEAELCSTP